MAARHQRTADRPQLRPIGVITSVLKDRKGAPRQGAEGAPDAWLEIYQWAADGLLRLAVGDEIVVITWPQGASACPAGASAIGVAQSTDRRLRDEVTRQTKSARTSSGGCPRHRGPPSPHRTDRGDRRHPGRRHQAGDELSAQHFEKTHRILSVASAPVMVLSLANPTYARGFRRSTSATA